jgi:hypothetical protein
LKYDLSKKYYLSGSISNNPDFKAYFKNHENTLRDLGVTDIFNPADTAWPENVDWDTCMKYDLKVLVDCAYVVLLPNWKNSRGAIVEYNVAKALNLLNIQVVNFNDLYNELRDEVIYNGS